MTLPFSLGTLPLPDWMPAWLAVLLLLLALVYGLLALTVPFSVFGLKGRLELLDARLEEIQLELGTLRQRHAEPPELPRPRAAWREARPAPDADADIPPPPLPPARMRPPPAERERLVEEPQARPRAGVALSRAMRAEPRIEWPNPSGPAP